MYVHGSFIYYFQNPISVLHLSHHPRQIKYLTPPPPLKTTKPKTKKQKKSSPPTAGFPKEPCGPPGGGVWSNFYWYPGPGAPSFFFLSLNIPKGAGERRELIGASNKKPLVVAKTAKILPQKPRGGGATFP